MGNIISLESGGDYIIITPVLLTNGAVAPSEPYEPPPSKSYTYSVCLGEMWIKGGQPGDREAHAVAEDIDLRGFEIGDTIQFYALWKIVNDPDDLPKTDATDSGTVHLAVVNS